MNTKEPNKTPRQIMKCATLFVLCVLVGGCASRGPAPTAVLRQVDPVLGRVTNVTRFEGRLSELDALIEKGANPEERIATLVLPGKPGYFPPRTLRIVYVITDHGLILVKSAETTALGSHFVSQGPNNT